VPPPVQAATAPSLGTASNIVVLGGTAVTCTTSGVAGDVSSLVSVTGFPGLCTLIGTVRAADAATTTAFNDVALAYDVLKAMPCTAANNLTGQPLGGKTLAPGVYCFPSTTADLTTGTLTLDGGGDSNAVWVFQVGTAITTGTSSVAMINGGQQRNVFWQLGTAATIGTDTAFKGNILAGSAITFSGVNSSLVGRAFAKTAVTMTGANISLGQ
jgi:type VI secretion system secreted protein VgrG